MATDQERPTDWALVCLKILLAGAGVVALAVLVRQVFTASRRANPSAAPVPAAPGGPAPASEVPPAPATPAAAAPALTEL